jgi:TonB family protein
MGRYFWCCRAGSNSSTGPGSAGIPGSFARRAGLSRGQAATVVLVVEFLADGRTGSVEVSRSSGNSAADAEAIAYVRLLRWTPGTRDRRAEAMRVSLPVTRSSSAYRLFTRCYTVTVSGILCSGIPPLS